MARDAGHCRRSKSFWTGTRGVKKAALVSRHLSSNFVANYYEFIRTLGKGSFGQVDLVRDRTTGQERVCKIVNTSGMHPKILEMMRKEVQVLSGLDHPHIVKIFEFAEDPVREELVLILEYVSGGNCLELLRSKDGVLREKLVARVVHQLLLALEYCHVSGVANRDVKLENILLTEASDGNFDCKIIDFGFATPYKRKVREMAGTARYLAPEVAIQQMGYSPEADIWSVGVTAFELLAGAAPFGREHDCDNPAPVFERLRRYTNFDDLAEVLAEAPGFTKRQRSSKSKDFLRWLLNPDPNARPTAADAAKHAWLSHHRAPTAGLTTEMLQSMIGYAAAPALQKSCLFAIAAKCDDLPDLELLNAAFLDADGDKDGKVSREELTMAVDQARGWWGPRVDANAVLRAADADKKGFLGYTEFVAVCLHNRLGPNLDAELVERAFDSLDHDRDGFVRMEDICPLFRELPRELPRDRPFTLEEWQDSLIKSGKKRRSKTIFCGL